MRIQTKTKTETIEIQTTTIETITVETIDTITVAIIKITHITIIAIRQINNKTEITQTNNQADIATKQITSPGIVKLVSIAENWDICFANAEHHDQIKTKGNKIRLATKTRKNSMKTVTQIPPSNKIL